MTQNSEKNKERKVFGPCSEKQQLVLLDDETDILIAGGGAGSGKSHTSLVKALKYINDPNARVMIVRRSYPMLKLSGGLVDESKNIYPHFKGRFKIQPLTWVFPNGATIQFAALPDDLGEWQGLQATHILVDEIAEFQENEVLFLMSRLRSAKYKGHMSLMGTCNPSRQSFLFNWVEFSLDENTGIPKAGTEHIQRWMINIEGKVYWADSLETLWTKYGEPLGLDREKNFKPLKFRYIPMTIYDNPVLLKNNPGYLANLLGQSRVNQLRFLHGSWTARPDGAGFFRRDWIKFIDAHELPPNATSRVRAWDFAASVVSETTPNPDWTAGTKMSRDKNGYYYVEDVQRFRMLTDGVLKEVIKTSHNDGLDDCKVMIPKDPGAAGKTANGFFLRTMAENGIYARSVPVSGHTSKHKRFLPFCTLAESGFVIVVRGDWNEAWLAELECFEENNRNQKDDQVDSTSDAFNTLAREVQLPTFALPSLDQPAPVPRLQ
jgi:predicted phage terminase large subunit-like protein